MENEKLNITGTIHIEVRDKAGSLLLNTTEKNLVVNGGRNAVAALLGGSAANKNITQIGFGTGSVMPSPPDAALTGTVLKNISTVQYPSVGAVRFNWLLDYADANGLAIREFGLFCADGSLFNRKTRDAINKTADISISGYWDIQF